MSVSMVVLVLRCDNVMLLHYCCRCLYWRGHARYYVRTWCWLCAAVLQWPPFCDLRLTSNRKSYCIVKHALTYAHRPRTSVCKLWAHMYSKVHMHMHTHTPLNCSCLLDRLVADVFTTQRSAHHNEVCQKGLGLGFKTQSRAHTV